MMTGKRATRTIGHLVVLITLAILFGGSVINAYALRQANLDGAGYLDFSYGDVITAAPTGEKPESKLWWNDGIWWGILWNASENTYRIYELDWEAQTWADTGVDADSRPQSKADVLWDQAGSKLYVVSHFFTEYSRKVTDAGLWGRLYRFSFDQGSQSYSLDSGFPVYVNDDQTETLVVDKDSTGRLWIAYPSRETGSAPYQVYVNASSGTGNDKSWGTPFSLTSLFPEAEIAPDDIASLAAFRDNQGDKIGVMWTNQLTNSAYFASRKDTNSDPLAGWTLQSISLGSISIDDHISLKSLTTNSSGQVFAVIKTGATQPDQPLILVVARDKDGSFSSHTYSTKSDGDTRPILLIHEGDPADAGDDSLFVFVAGNEGGSKICYKVLRIYTPLSAMGDFSAGNCGTPFIWDSTYKNIDNATSTKQNVNNVTGIVVLASDDYNGQVYVHNIIGKTGETVYLPLIIR